MSEPNLESPEPDPFSRVTYAFAAGWHRMVWLLFAGPNAVPRSWLMWGVLALFSGAVGIDFGSQLAFPSDFTGDDRDYSLPTRFHAGPILGLVALVILLGLLGLYVTSCVRFALLEAVLSGRPRLRGVLAATTRPGWQLFLMHLMVIVVWLVLMLPMLLAAWPALRALADARAPTQGAVLLSLAALVFWALPVCFASVVFLWWLNDLVLPIAWRRGLRITAAMRIAGRLTSKNLGAVLLMAIGRFLVSIASGLFGGCLICAGCCFWFPFAGLAAWLGWVSWRMPAAALLTLPLGLFCALTAAWLIATLLSPLVVLRQAWAYAFVASLDPELGDWTTVD